MTNEREKLTLHVKTVIGTGDALDAIMLIPLIADWGVPRECLWNMTGEVCKASLDRLYVLDEPFQGFRTVGVCEQHHKELSGG